MLLVIRILFYYFLASFSFSTLVRIHFENSPHNNYRLNRCCCSCRGARGIVNHDAKNYSNLHSILLKKWKIQNRAGSRSHPTNFPGNLCQCRFNSRYECMLHSDILTFLRYSSRLLLKHLRIFSAQQLFRVLLRGDGNLVNPDVSSTANHCFRTSLNLICRGWGVVHLRLYTCGIRRLTILHQI